MSDEPEVMNENINVNFRKTFILMDGACCVLYGTCWCRSRKNSSRNEDLYSCKSEGRRKVGFVFTVALMGIMLT